MKRDHLLQAAVLCGLAALGLSLYVGWHGAPLSGDLWLTAQIQRVGQLERNAGLINRAPMLLWYVFSAASLLVAFGGRLGQRARAVPSRQEALSAMALGIVLVFGDQLLKEILRSPRPSVDLGVRVDQAFPGYGFPSGHVYSDMLLYGLLAAIAPAWLPGWLVLPARALAVAIILLAGPARVVVGAHWPSDTLGGYLWGSAALCLSLWFGRWVARRG